ncbi:acyl-CoA dehydrogenase family protein [Methylococcus sp. EFPC2]|uniref:acyl-CoA dehydrogenase family protein n=1 Tax=Methylococcus sp. EFPC2 TaxID=2812648 RepID=UPI001968908A|nr:acyl-CoA dehydrogenase [Methylococcus sp. EFPC2]QSA98879.1 acyl-CoA dehydrogenase [Methylococcus sp. EFPC2]
MTDALSLPPYTGPASLRERFRRVAANGLLSHALPAEFGGRGDDYLALCQTHRKLGKISRDPGLVLMVNAHLWGAVFPLLRHGDEKQRKRFLPPLIRGDWLAGHAITEPGCGTDVQAMTARAKIDGDGYRLHGEKRYITNAPLADWLIVYARLDGPISAFLVHRDDPGCRFTDEHALQACRGSTTGGVWLNDCRIGADRLLGKPGAGERILQQALEYERAFIFAGITGVMDWQLEQVVARSRQRLSGNGHLGRHQAIAHRIADMTLRLNTLNLWLQECARLADTGQRLTLAAAQTKLYAAEAFLQSSLDAVHLFGALGLEAESGLVELVQDALAGRLFSGSSEALKNLIAALSGTGEGYRARR